MKRLVAILLVVGLLASVAGGTAWADGGNHTQHDDPKDDVYPLWPHLFPWPDPTRGLSYLYDSVTATIPKYLVEQKDYLRCIAATYWNEYEENADVVPDEGTLIWETGQTAIETDPQGDSPVAEGDLLSFTVWEPDSDHLSSRFRHAVPVRQVPAVVSPYAVLMAQQGAGGQSGTDQTYYYVWLYSATSQEEFQLCVMYDNAATASRIVHPAYDFCDIRRARMEQSGSYISATVTLEGDVPLPPPEDARGLYYFFGFAPPGDPHAQPFSYLSVSWDGAWQGEMGKITNGVFEPVCSVPISIDGKQLSVSGSIIALGLPPTFAWVAATMSVIGPAGDEYAASLDSAPDTGLGYVEMTLEPFPVWTVYLPIVVKS